MGGLLTFQQRALKRLKKVPLEQRVHFRPAFGFHPSNARLLGEVFGFTLGVFGTDALEHFETVKVWRVSATVRDPKVPFEQTEFPFEVFGLVSSDGGHLGLWEFNLQRPFDIEPVTLSRAESN